MLQAALLALIAGYADAVGYVEFHAFAGLMTGNTIFLGVDLANRDFARAGFHALIVLIFLIGVIFARLAIRAGLQIWMVLTVTAALLVVCSFSNAASGALLLALGMGLQNSAANRFNGVALNHVFITGNLQKLGEEIVHWLWPAKGAQPQGAAIFAGVWAAYAGGAFLGAVAQTMMSKPLLLPAFLLPFVMLRAK